MMVNSDRKLTSKDCYSLLEEKNSKNMDTKFAAYVEWSQSSRL